MSGCKSNTGMRKKKQDVPRGRWREKNERILETTAGECTPDIRNQGDARVDSGPGEGSGEGEERASPTPARHPIQIKKWPRKREGKERGRQEG